MVSYRTRQVLLLLVVFLLGAAVGGLVRPGGSQPLLAEEEKLVCPLDGHELEVGWLYCPWDGIPVEAIRRGWVKVASHSYTPKEAVVAFYEALRKQDGPELSAVLDVESIFTHLIVEALATQEDLPEELQEEIQERIVKPSARLLRYYLLDFVTSPVVRKYFRVPLEVNSELLGKLFYEEVDASTAIVGPSRLLRERGARSILLRRDAEDGSWRIAEFPLEVAGSPEQ